MFNSPKVVIWEVKPEPHGSDSTSTLLDILTVDVVLYSVDHLPLHAHQIGQVDEHVVYFNYTTERGRGVSHISAGTVYTVQLKYWTADYTWIAVTMLRPK